MIIGTTSERSVLQQLNLVRSFNKQVAVPNVNDHNELASVLREVKAFDNEEDVEKSLHEIRETTQSDELGVGIKDVLFSIATARQSDDKPGRFAEEMATMMAQNRM